MKKLLLFLLLLSFSNSFFAQTPANDLCSNALDLGVLSSTIDVTTPEVDTSLATNTLFTSTCDPLRDDFNDVWYQFTMPAGTDGVVQVYDASLLEFFTLFDSCGGVEIDCFRQSGYFNNLAAGETYILRYAEDNGDLSDFSLKLYEELPNDECVDSETLTLVEGMATTVDTDLRASNASPGLPNPCGANASHTYVDAWYDFVMPFDGNIVIQNNSSTEAITLYNTCGDTMDVGCEFGSGIIYNLTGGDNYLLRYSDRDIQLNGDSDFSLTPFPILTNDECVDRETLVIPTTEQLTVTSELRGATPSTLAGLANPCGANTSHTYVDAWYEFTMPVTGNLVITNNDSASEALTLYDMCGSTVELECEFGSGYFYNLPAGTTYIMRYSDRDISLNSNSDFRLQAFPAIANDECADRETLVIPTADQLTVTSELRSATPSTLVGLANPCGANALHTYVDLWYEFTMPVTGNLAITNNDSASEALTLYDMCGSTIELACEFGSGYFYNLPAGTTYIMRYSDRDISVNTNSDFRLQAFATLDNDDCADRETIVVTTTEELLIDTDLRASTPSPGIPNPCGANTSHVYTDAWYEFTMPVTGNLVISNSNSASEAITLYDACGDTLDVGCEFGSGLIYNLTENQVYVLRYSDRDIAVNTNSDFSLQAFETAPNDECANATSLNLSALNPSFISIDLRSASNDSEISCENNVSRIYPDVWYDMTMPVDGEIQVNNVSNNMFIAFFDACDGTELTCFFNDGSLFNVAAGTNVKMRASVRDNIVGLYTFDVIAIPAPLPSCVGTTEFIGGVWNNGIPDNTMNAIIRSNYNTSTTIDPTTMMPYGSLEACSISIDSGRTLTIASEDYLEVTGNILVNGTLNVAHQGSLVQLDPLAITTNSGTINVDVTTPDLPARSFMILGSPMTAETRTDVFANAFRVRNHDASLFIPDPTVAAAFPMAENFADDNGDNWINYSGTINPAEGYLVSPQPNINASGTYNLTYSEGTLNNGDITFPIVFNTDKNSSPNIMANPYPSAILADDFINANAMVDEVFFWEHLTPPSASLPGYNTMNFTMEDISMYNLMGGVKASSDTSPDEDTKPNGIISTAQGFGIKANAAGTAVFTNSMRRLTGNTTLRAPEEQVDKVWVAIETPEHNLKSNTLIGFSKKTTAQLDAGYDSNRLASILSIFTGIANSDVELGIQSREQFNEEITVPLGFSSLIDASTLYRISLNDIEGIALNEATIYLEDHLTGNKINLSENVYEFTSEKGQFSNRFTLYFKNSILDVTSETLTEFTIAPNPGTGIFTVRSQNQLIDNINVYDYLGRIVAINNDLNISETNIDISAQASGVYFITVETANGALTKKYIKK